MWPYTIPGDKRACPIGGRNCYAASFDTYREMLDHCRQKHPEKFSIGEIETTELVVTDHHGKVLSWDEIRRIVSDPSFWHESFRAGQK